MWNQLGCARFQVQLSYCEKYQAMLIKLAEPAKVREMVP